MRFLTQVTPPVTEPIDLTTAKQHLRQDITDDDTIIGDYITGARQWVEKTLGRSLMTQTWDYSIDAFPPNGVIELPRPPLQSVTSLTYTDSTGASVVWPASNYQVDVVNEPGRLALAVNAAWPSVTLRSLNGVVVRFVAGYGAATDVPWTLKVAQLLLIAHWYENREPIMAMRGVTPIEIPFTIQALLQSSGYAAVS